MIRANAHLAGAILPSPQEWNTYRLAVLGAVRRVSSNQSEPLPHNSSHPSNDKASGQGVIILPMPKLSHTMTHGRVLKWHVTEGSSIAEYDVILTVETDTLVEEAYRVDQFAGKVSYLRRNNTHNFYEQLFLRTSPAFYSEVPLCYATYCVSAFTFLSL